MLLMKKRSDHIQSKVVRQFPRSIPISDSSKIGLSPSAWVHVRPVFITSSAFARRYGHVYDRGDQTHNKISWANADTKRFLFVFFFLCRLEEESNSPRQPNIQLFLHRIPQSFVSLSTKPANQIVGGWRWWDSRVRLTSFPTKMAVRRRPIILIRVVIYRH